MNIMSSHLGKYKAKNEDSQEIRMEKDLITTSGKENIEFTSQTKKIPKQRKHENFIQGA
jgi:hypothetical protein